MSRLEFRAAVEAPRPAAAWVMVGVGGATLWITRQLDVWAVVAQVALLILSLHLRTRPHPLQKNSALLNGGLLAIVAASIAVALRGQPATIALAHFAALAQGLQLLDARPRRSEFLLVALALFQVILAANLTDSVFFFPLLAAFVVATTWTLMVHTLRTEAAEADMPGAVSMAITPGLLRTTLVASALSLAVAMLFFLALPRLRSSVVTAGSFGLTLSAAGFSDRVELGDLGRIRQDATVVMRVVTLEGDAPSRRNAYWRGLAFDTFDGRTWSVTPPTRRILPGNSEVGISLSNSGLSGGLVQQVVREPVAAGVIFTPGRPEQIQGDLGRVHRDRNGSLYAPAHIGERVRYVIHSDIRKWSDAELALDRTTLPARRDRLYLALPALREPVEALARRITADAQNDADRLRSLERYLRIRGQYDDQPPPIPADDPRSPVEIFLFGELAGHCEYFASSMVVLARSLGIPSRVVNGFAGGRENRIGGFVELTRNDAHSWVEAHFENAGWVRYDPTPPDLRLRAAAGASWFDRVGELGSALELWWFRRVVDFDRSDQFRAMRTAWLTWRKAKRWTSPGAPSVGVRSIDWRFDGPLATRTLLLAAAGVAGLSLAARLRRRRSKGDGPPATYRAALRLLARRGHERAAHVTSRDFVLQVRAHSSEAVAAAFDVVTEAYLLERFGGVCVDARPSLRELRSALGAQARHG